MTTSRNPVLTTVFGVHSPASAGMRATAHVRARADGGNPWAFFPAALPYAEQASNATGVEVAVVLAQWADEQGYQWPPMFNNPGNVGDPWSAGQQGYATIEDGVEAYIQTMMLDYYTNVRESYGDFAQSYALGQSPWAGGHYDQDGPPPGEDLVKIIAEFNLVQYDGDQPVPVPPTPQPVPPPPPVIMKPLKGKIGMLNAPVVAIVTTASNKGYTEVGADGGTFNFGDAPDVGSLANIKLNAPIVGAKRTKSGKGLYMVATDGGVFALGDAEFFGSAGSLKLNQPVVDIALTDTGKGYWLTAADGGIFNYGDAKFYGSMA